MNVSFRGDILHAFKIQFTILDKLNCPVGLVVIFYATFIAWILGCINYGTS